MQCMLMPCEAEAWGFGLQTRVAGVESSRDKSNPAQINAADAAIPPGGKSDGPGRDLNPGGAVLLSDGVWQQFNSVIQTGRSAVEFRRWN